jgi:hypothetical protein
METPHQAKELREMAAHTETTLPELERLAACDFVSQEIVSLLWLRQWYQTGGSDRMAVLRQWEFLTFLVRIGKLDV